MSGMPSFVSVEMTASFYASMKIDNEQYIFFVLYFCGGE